MTDQRSQQAQAWRGWYKLAAWHKLRAWRLRTEPLCRLCAAIGRIVPATIVDHVKPHKGNRQRFFNPDNTQSLCKACHDRHKQAQERNGTLAGADVDGLPLDPGHHWR